MWMKCVGGPLDGEWMMIGPQASAVNTVEPHSCDRGIFCDCPHVPRIVTYTVRRFMHPSWKITLPYLTLTSSDVPDEPWLRAGAHWPLKLKEEIERARRSFTSK